MNNELKPVRCGCGGEPVIWHNFSGLTFLSCKSCEITSKGYDNHFEAIEAWNRAMGANRVQFEAVAKDIDVPGKFATDTNVVDKIESHDEKYILEGCIQMMQELADYFGEYLEWIGNKPKSEEEKTPFAFRYFTIVQHLFLWHTEHAGGTSTRAKCRELGIEDASDIVEFRFWNEDDEEEEWSDDE